MKTISVNLPSTIQPSNEELGWFAAQELLKIAPKGAIRVHGSIAVALSRDCYHPEQFTTKIIGFKATSVKLISSRAVLINLLTEIPANDDWEMQLG